MTSLYSFKMLTDSERQGKGVFDVFVDGTMIKQILAVEGNNKVELMTSYVDSTNDVVEAEAKLSYLNYSLGSAKAVYSSFEEGVVLQKPVNDFYCFGTSGGVARIGEMSLLIDGTSVGSVGGLANETGILNARVDLRQFGIKNSYNYKCRVSYDNGEVAEKEGVVMLDTDLVDLNVVSPVANGAYVGEMNLVLSSDSKNLDSVWFVNPLTGANETYNGAKTMGLPTGTYNISVYANNTLGVVTAQVVGFRVVPADHSVYFYGPFGILLEQGNGKERFKWIGKEIDTATGLYLIGAREYEADTGAFIQPDLVVSNVYDPLAWNRYTYGRGNPYRYVDRDGKWVVEAVSGAIGVAVGAIDAYDMYEETGSISKAVEMGVVSAGVTFGACEASVYSGFAMATTAGGAAGAVKEIERQKLVTGDEGIFTLNNGLPDIPFIPIPISHISLKGWDKVDWGKVLEKGETDFVLSGVMSGVSEFGGKLVDKFIPSAKTIGQYGGKLPWTKLRVGRAVAYTENTLGKAVIKGGAKIVLNKIGKS